MEKENQEVQHQDNSAVEESRRAVEKNHSKNTPKTSQDQEEQTAKGKKIGETQIGKGLQSVSKHLHKAAAEARHDTRDIADVTLSMDIKKKKGKESSDEKIEGEPTIGGVEIKKDQAAKKEVSKQETTTSEKSESPKEQTEGEAATSEKKEIRDASEATQKDVSKSSEVKKKKNDDEEELNDLEKSFGSEKEGHDGEVYSLEKVSDDSVLGTGKRTNNINDLRPTHHIGYMNRETLPNGQTIAALNIDKDQWLQNATPDKNGNLIVSLYSERFKGNDNFSHSTFTIPKKYVQGLAPDANGRIKLMVVEKNPLAKKSELQVMVDNAENRKSVAMKNGNILNDTPELKKDRILDQKLKDNGLEHGYTSEINLTGREVVNKMNPDKQKLVDAMKPKELENMLNHPDNRNIYTGYEARFKEKMLEKFKEGMPLKVDNKLTGGDGTGASTIKHVNSNKEQFLVKTDDGKQHQISKNEMLSASTTVEEGKKIMGEVVKDIADNVKVDSKVQKEAIETIPEISSNKENTPKYIISNKSSFSAKVSEIVVGTELILEAGSIKKGIEELKANKAKALKREAGYSEKDIENPAIKAPKVITQKEAEKLKAIVENKVVDPKESQKEQKGKSLEQVLDKQITPETKMKDIVNKMDTSDQGAIKKMNPETLENQIEVQKSDLQKSAEKLEKEPVVDIKGQSKEQKTPSELLKEAIYKNDKESVNNILSKEKNVVDKTHIELMKDMKKEGIKLDEGISKAVTQSLPAPKQTKGVSV